MAQQAWGPKWSSSGSSSVCPHQRFGCKWWGSGPSAALIVFCVHREVVKGAHVGKLVSHIWRRKGQGPKEKVSLRHHGMTALESATVTGANCPPRGIVSVSFLFHSPFLNTGPT